MQLSEDKGRGKYQIRAYEPGVITVNETTYQNSIIIGQDNLVEHWQPNCLDELTDDALNQILSFSPNIILLGTGKHFIMPSAKQLKILHQQKVGIECMDTGAACRTFVALSSEGRNVVAALLID